MTIFSGEMDLTVLRPSDSEMACIDMRRISGPFASKRPRKTSPCIHCGGQSVEDEDDQEFVYDRNIPINIGGLILFVERIPADPHTKF